MEYMTPNFTKDMVKDVYKRQVHHFIGAGIVGIAVPDRTVGVQIIFQVGVGDGVRVERIDIAGHLKGFRPACFGVFLRRNAVHITVLFHVLTDLRHQVGSVAFAADTGPDVYKRQDSTSTGNTYMLD